MKTVDRLCLGRVLFVLGLLVSPYASGQTFTWGGGSGSWGAAAKWGGVIPDSDAANVLIDGGAAGVSAVTLDAFRLVNNMTVDAGDSLEIDPDVAMAFGVYGNLTVNGRIGSATNRAMIPFFHPTTARLEGTGTLYTNGFGPVSGQLTIGSGLTVDVGYASLNGDYINQGHIVMNQAGGGLSMNWGVNAGHIEVTGGNLDLVDVKNALGGLITVTNGTLYVQNNWKNDGEIRLNNSTATFREGHVTSGDVMRVQALGGPATVIWRCAIDNTGQTLQLEGKHGKVYLSRDEPPNGGPMGSIKGGTINAVNGGELFLSGATLENVALSGNIKFDPAAPILWGRGRVTLDQLALTVPDEAPWGGPSISFTGANATLDGDGEITLKGYGGGSTAGVNGEYDNPLTIGSGITIRGHGYVSNAINKGLIYTGSGAMTITLTNVTNMGSIRIDPGTILELKPPDGATSVQLLQSAGAVTRINGQMISDLPVEIDGGILAGSGQISLPTGQAFTLGNTVTPGNSIGTLSVTSDVVVFKADSHFEVELSGVSSADLLAITGDLDLSASNNYLDLLPEGSLTGNSYVILTYTGTRTGTFEQVTPGYNVQYQPGQVVVTPVPEPGCVAVLGMVGLALLARRSRGLRA